MYGKQELENIEYKKLNYKNFENVIFLFVATVLQLYYNVQMYYKSGYKPC